MNNNHHCISRRHCHVWSGGGGGDGGGGGGGARASAYDQFHSQRKACHKHSFYEKGSVHGGKGSGGGGTGQGEGHGQDPSSQHTHNGGGGGAGECGYAGPDGGTSRGAQFGKLGKNDDSNRGNGGSGGGPWSDEDPLRCHTSSTTAHERRDMAGKWENAFFGRVHFDDGMHERFREAVSADEHERLVTMTNEQLFPDWPADEEAPPHLFRKTAPAMQLRYILNRLSMGERRVRYAADYGSLSMMYQLSLGELMVGEAERHLDELGWMTDELREKIEEVKRMAAKTNYDYDLD